MSKSTWFLLITKLISAVPAISKPQKSIRLTWMGKVPCEVWQFTFDFHFLSEITWQSPGRAVRLVSDPFVNDNAVVSYIALAEWHHIKLECIEM